MNWQSLLLALVALTGATALRGNVSPSPLFTDHAVLQRDAVVPIWGAADPAEKISVSFAGQRVETTADQAGEWTVNLAALSANVSGALVITGKNTVTLQDVVAGDVWLCSGQSNMARTVNRVENAAAEIAAATEPAIRHYYVPLHASPEPQSDRSLKSNWEVASPQTVGNFTAVGYFFAREIYRQLGVPIGIIHSSWGGTLIQPWMPLTAFQTYPGYKEMLERKQADIAAWPERRIKLDAELKAWETESAAAKAAGRPEPVKPWNPGPPDSGPLMPSQIYNGMIHPLVHYRIRGALWYQGEANAGSGSAGATDYTDLQSRLIIGWREAWSIGDFPFYFAQLPNWDNPKDSTHRSWAFFREGQAGTLTTVNTGMAVLIDIGDSADIHPKNKQDVGRRLALIALADTYGKKVIAHGPVLRTAKTEGDSIRVTFNFTDNGLIARGGVSLNGFEIAAADGIFVPANANIEGNDIIARNPQVPSPAFLRYAWANDPPVTLFNGAGLPAMPFRTDKLTK